MKPTTLLLATTILALTLSAAALVTAQNAPAARPTAVAVVDLSAVLNKLEEKTTIEADLQVQTQQLKQEQTTKEQEINQLRADLDVLSPDSEAYQTKQNTLEEKAVELQAWTAYQTQKLNRQAADQIERLYRKMLDAVEQTAKARGADLVLFKEQAVNFRGAKREQLPLLIQNRKVLYSAPDLDLTDEVLALMNNQYHSGTK